VRADFESDIIGLSLTTTTFALANSTPSQPHRTTPPDPSPLLKDVGPIDYAPSKYRKTIPATPAPPLSRGMWAAHHRSMEELGKEQYKGDPRGGRHMWYVTKINHDATDHLYAQHQCFKAQHQRIK